MSAASPAAAGSSSSPDAPKASILGRSLTAADVKITKLARMLSVTSQLDTFLLTTTYTVHLVHAILARATKARLERAATQLAERIAEKAPETMLPGETLIATIETAPSSRLLRAEQSTAAFNKVLDEFRMFMRLRNLPNLWTWGSGVLRRPAADATLHAIAVTQVTACVAFQGLENWAYLCSKGVFAAEPRRIGRAFLWAARCWMLHVVLEFVRLARVHQLRVRRELEAGVDEKEAHKVTKKEVETWWRELRINLAWMPLTVHWSMEGGYAGEAFVASLAGFAGWTNLIHQWRNTP